MKKLITLIALTLVLLTLYNCSPILGDPGPEGAPQYSYLTLIDTKTGKKTYLDRYDGYIKDDIPTRFVGNSNTDIVVMYRGAINRYNLDENTKNFYNFEEDNSTIDFYNYANDKFVFHDYQSIKIYDYNGNKLGEIDYDFLQNKAYPTFNDDGTITFSAYNTNNLKQVICKSSIQEDNLTYLYNLYDDSKYIQNAFIHPYLEKNDNSLYFLQTKNLQNNEGDLKISGIYRLELCNSNENKLTSNTDIYSPGFIKINYTNKIYFNTAIWENNKSREGIIEITDNYFQFVLERYQIEQYIKNTSILRIKNLDNNENYLWDIETNKKEPAIAGFYSQDMSKVIKFEETTANHKTLFGENK